MGRAVPLTQFFSLGCVSQEDEVYDLSDTWNINSFKMKSLTPASSITRAHTCSSLNMPAFC